MTITPEQRQELRKRWVEALRSGKYRQGRGRLEVAGKSCCLGVLCRVFDAQFPGTIEIKEDTDSHGIICFQGARASLPDLVIDAVGLGSGNGHFHGSSLTHLNDSGVPFVKIADIIESQPTGLFVDEPATVTV